MARRSDGRFLFTPSKSAQKKQKKIRSTQKLDNPPISDVRGETLNFDHYRELQKTVYEAGPDDLESLITHERALAKGEVIKGRDWEKIAIAVVIILIGGAVALFIANEVLTGGEFFGFGGGGGGGKTTTPVLIHPASTLLALMFPALFIFGRKPKVRKVNIGEVIQKFQADKDSPDFGKHPTSWYLGVERKDLKEPSERFIAKLKELGANPAEGPYPKEVVEAFGLDYDIMEEMKNHIIKRDLRIIFEGLGAKTGDLKDIPGDRIEQIQADPAGEIARLQQFNPNDKPLQVARMLRNHGLEEVTLDKWFAADCLYRRNLEATAKGLLLDVAERIRAMRGGEDEH